MNGPCFPPSRGRLALDQVIRESPPIRIALRADAATLVAAIERHAVPALLLAAAVREIREYARVRPDALTHPYVRAELDKLAAMLQETT
jgi:hypothetical protein